MRANRLILIFTICTKILLGQIAIKTNILYPLYYANNTFGGGIDIAVEDKLSSRFVLRVSLNIKSSPLSRQVSITNSLTTIRKRHLEKKGIRLAFKFYTKPELEYQMPKGFSIGAFADVMEIKRRAVFTENSLQVTDSLEGRGLYVAGGLVFGYTWRFKNWLLEPSLGLGYGTASTSVMITRDPIVPLDMSGTENFYIRMSATHFQLLFGYSF